MIEIWWVWPSLRSNQLNHIKRKTETKKTSTKVKLRKTTKQNCCFSEVKLTNPTSCFEHFRNISKKWVLKFKFQNLFQLNWKKEIAETTKRHKLKRNLLFLFKLICLTSTNKYMPNICLIPPRFIHKVRTFGRGRGGPAKCVLAPIGMGRGEVIQLQVYVRHKFFSQFRYKIENKMSYSDSKNYPFPSPPYS